ncbi:hypothetical protein KIN20_004983 [Parelaphostrongylus tenuis]|uniref:N-acetyltransferase domain-containing protein n=1 Tax=Parelaphostrongylus tenuis TaxID=148309 RepID=A0AAD5MHQ3_PARTN|nr:hypothetical protein KIN20_004983 [Parelaphostrongylus tenuis]
MTRKPLEPFKEVLKRQKPEIPGEPYIMQEASAFLSSSKLVVRLPVIRGWIFFQRSISECFQNSLPKAVGNPWKGAYSKHGFWYKFHEGDKNDFDKLVALSFEQDKYMLNYDYMKVWEKSYGEGSVRILVAKNLKNDVMGGVVAIKKKEYAQIGTYFVVEDYRHSGIGSKLFAEITKGLITTFQAMHHLLPTVPSFGLATRYGRRFNHVKVDSGSGFPDLKENLEDHRTVLDEDLNASEWMAITTFDADVSGEQRPIRDILNLEASKTAAVFDKKRNCVGFGTSRELAGITSNVHIGSSLYMENNMKEKIDRKRKAAWAAIRPLKEATDQLTDQNSVLTLLIQRFFRRFAMQLRRGLILRPRQDCYD